MSCIIKSCVCESMLMYVEGVWAYVCLYGGVKEIIVRASFFTATIYHDHAAVTCTKHKLSSYSHKNSVAYFSFFLIQYHINDYTAIFVDQQQLPADSGVAMEIDASRDGLDYYVTTPQKIYRLSLDNCGTHSSCVSCVQSANPLCGWCSTEGRCMPTDSCSTAGTFTGHNNASSCPAFTNVSPEQAYIVNNETVSCTLQY